MQNTANASGLGRQPRSPDRSVNFEMKADVNVGNVSVGSALPRG